MSIVFNEWKPNVMPIILMFLRDADKMLNTRIDFETRVAMTEKWLYVFEGLGMKKIEFDAETADEDELRRAVKEMLKWVAWVIKAARS